MCKKYEFTEETLEWNGRTLHRIRAIKNFSDVKAGDLGGWVQSDSNLSYYGDCWIYNEGKAVDNARIMGNAKVMDNAIIMNNAKIYDNAIMHNCAKMRGNAVANEKAALFNYATVEGKATISGEAIMCDYAKLSETACVKDYTIICDFAELSGSAQSCGKTRIGGHSLFYEGTFCGGEYGCFSDINPILFTNIKFKEI